MHPEGWVEVPLGEIVAETSEILGVHDAEPTVFSITKHQGVVPASDYHDRRIASADLSRYKRLRAGDFAYSTIHIDEGVIWMNRLNNDGVISPMYKTFRLRGQSVLPSYLDEMLRTPGLVSEYRARQQGSINRRKSLSFAKFAAIAMSLPPLPEQRRIVDLLDAVDAAIDAARQQQEAVAEARKALLAEMMQAREGRIETKIEGVLEASVGGIWGVDPGLDEVDVTVYRSTDFGPRSQLRHPGGVLRSVKRRQLGTRLLHEGDVLLEKSGGGPNQPVGRVVRVPSLAEPSFCGNFIHLLRADRARIDPNYLFYVLDFWHGTGRTLEFQAATTGIRNLRTKGYLAEVIALPALSEQRRVVDLLDAVDTVGDVAIQQHAALTEARSNLLTDLLSGDHRIPESYDHLLEAV